MGQAGCSYGFATKLVPPINIDGKQYTLLVRFHDYPSLGNDDEIVSGEIESVVDIGGGYKKIVCALGRYYFSQTHVLGAGNSYEEVVMYYAGGNICIAPEPAIGSYCYSDAKATTGPNSANRAQDGHTLIWNNKKFLITKALAFHEAPDSISWQLGNRSQGERITVGLVGEDDFKGWQFPLSTYNANDVAIDTTLGDIYDDAGITWEDTAVESGSCSRKIFLSSPDYFPSDACLDFAEFWYDPIHYGLRFCSTNALRAGDSKPWSDVDLLKVTWYARDIQGEMTLGTTKVFAFEGDGDGLSDSGDSIATIFDTVERPDPFALHSQQITIGKSIGSESGLMWREDYSADSPFIAWVYDEDGNVTLKYRLLQGGSISSNPVSGTHPIPVTLKLEEISAGTIRAWYDVGAGFVLHDTISLDLTYSWFGGVFGSSGSSIRAYFNADTDVEVLPVGTNSDSGVLSYRLDNEVYTPYATKWYWEHDKPFTGDIEEIRNVSADVDMTLVVTGTDLQRDTYMISGSTLIFSQEAFGDSVTATYDSDESLSAPGRCPGGPKNFSNDDGVVEHNIGQYRDCLYVYDPNGELTAIGGEDFSVITSSGFDPRTTFSLYYDEENNASTDFTQIPDGSLIKNALSRYVLVEDVWVESNIFANKRYCFEGVGSRFVRFNGASPRYLNEARDCIQTLNTCRVSITQGDGAHICGEGQMYPVPTTRFCDEEGNNVWGGWTVGVTGAHVDREKANAWFQKRSGTRWFQAFSYFGNRIATPGIVLPYGWMEIDGVPEQGDLHYNLGGICQTYKEYYTQCPGLALQGMCSGGALNPSVGWCSDGYCGDPLTPSEWYEGDRGITNAMATFFAWASTGGQDFCGCNYYESWAVGHEEISPEFNFTPTYFQPGNRLKRMLDNTTINWAKMEFELSGAWQRVRNKEWDATVVVNDIDGIGENFSFSLMKMKKDSRNYDPPCPTDPKPPYQSEFALLGQGGVIGGAINQQEISGVIDCTGMIQALIDDKDSPYGYYFLFPSQGTSLVLGADQSTFLRGLLPDSYGAASSTGLYFTNMVMQYWDTLSVSNIIVNFTLPSGEEKTIRVPYIVNAIE